jgi:HK97 family phage portal protein
MDIFGKKALAKQIDNLLSTVKAFQDNRLASFSTQIFPNYKSLREQIVFQTMDDIYSVVSRLATTAAMVPYYGKDKNGEDIQENDKLNLILNQLTFEFKEKMHLNLLISGEIFLLKERTLGVNASIILRNLNPSNVIVKVSDSFPYDITGYKYMDQVRGTSFDIPFEDMVYIKLENPTFENDEFRGLSPVKVLANRLTRLQAQLDISVAQMQNGGLPGILYDKSPMFTPELAAQHKENFGRFLNNRSNKNAPYFTGGDIGYVSIGSTLADLDLASLADIDFDKICNVYGVSSTWFNNKSAATESNVKEMVRLVYTNAVLPHIMRIQDALNTQLVSELNNGSKIYYDISEIPELQEDMLNKANVYATMPVIVPNEVREALGYNKIDDPLMDQPLIKQGYMTIDDVYSSDINLTGDYAANSGQVSSGNQ